MYIYIYTYIYIQRFLIQDHQQSMLQWCQVQLLADWEQRRQAVQAKRRLFNGDLARRG